MRSVLVVSPHRDDAAFSCAIAIRWFARTCRVTIANCFTVSQYAPYRTDEPGTVTELRLNEDRVFASHSGVALNDVQLVDAPERLGVGVSDISTTRALTGIDFESMSEIQAHVRTIDAKLVLAPLSIGDHIDHRITREAVLQSGFSAIGFYEDLPYAARNPDWRLLDLVDSTGMELHPWTVRADDGYAWKCGCASFYRSQILPETAEEIALFGARYENGERYWMSPKALQFVHSLDHE